MRLILVRFSTLGLAVLLGAAAARASVGVLVGEPYGSFGTMMPVGHTALYFDHLCAATPTTLRPCLSGEAGTVVARYHRIADLDWLATPVIPFLYGVDDAADAPAVVTDSLERDLRERYRAAHLESIVPDRVGPGGDPLPARSGEWTETIGSAFDRRLFLYEVDTTPEQDAAILAWLNTLPDHRRYSLRHANCANFAADAINHIFPNAIHRNGLADFGMLTPKQAARSFAEFARAHPGLHPRVYEIPQLPGTLRRSRPLRGAAEMFVTTKRYVAALAVLQPEALLADWAIYEKRGKWQIGDSAVRLTPAMWEQGPQRLAPPPLTAVALRCLIDSNAQPSRSTCSSTAALSMGFFAK